jgi:orotidine-5'-phosphate decarboxylase
VLTSLDRRSLQQELGVTATVEGHVLRLAERAREAGLDGCVASAREIALLRGALGPSWVIVTPGIRPVERGDDQVRTATPRAAIEAGAHYLVVGRPITAAPDPAVATRAIIEEIARA